MPALSQAEREKIVEEIFDKSNSGTIDSLTDEEMLAFVGACDDWIVAHMSDFNLALPQPARSTLTPREKAWGFFLTARRRWRKNA